MAAKKFKVKCGSDIELMTATNIASTYSKDDYIFEVGRKEITAGQISGLDEGTTIKVTQRSRKAGF